MPNPPDPLREILEEAERNRRRERARYADHTTVAVDNEISTGGGGGGGDGDGAFYEYVQTVASATWVIHHDLDCIPDIVILDAGGNPVDGVLTYPDNNTVVVAFGSPESGRARLDR